MKQVVNLHEILEFREITVKDDITLRPLAISDAGSILKILDADTSIRKKVTVASRFS